jgi:transposase
MKGVAGAAAVTRHKPGPRKLRPLAGPATRSSSGELAKARVEIAELERKIGQQALDIDFFHKALRALDAADRQGSIAAASRKSSKP